MSQAVKISFFCGRKPLWDMTVDVDTAYKLGSQIVDAAGLAELDENTRTLIGGFSDYSPEDSPE